MSLLDQSLDNCLKPETFREWLNLWSPEAIVGEANNCNDCPIANYVLYSIATEDEDIAVIVGSEILNIVDDRYETIVEYDLPEWATKFINSVDDSEMYITVRECLDILENIK